MDVFKKLLSLQECMWLEWIYSREKPRIITSKSGVASFNRVLTLNLCDGVPTHLHDQGGPLTRLLDQVCIKIFLTEVTTVLTQNKNFKESDMLLGDIWSKESGVELSWFEDESTQGGIEYFN